ncbi:MAG: YadA C-terminal domain-containing protein, partial [Neisseria sp.]|nr:YadA C-terminal domain-containing protein [Neisseria sp.]
ANGEISATSTDAINGAQLHNFQNTVNNNFGDVYNNINRLDDRIGQVDKDLRGAVAGATAMSNIPQVTIAGASMVGVAAGHYKGQSAMAIGVSKMSDGGNWIVKAKLGANTQGDINVGAGIGYQWR